MTKNKDLNHQLLSVTMRTDLSLNMGRLVTIYNDVKGDLPLFLRLCARTKKEGLIKQQIVEL
jgi:hypothetical protein